MAYFEFGIGKGIARSAYELTTRMAAAGHEVHYHCVAVDEHLKDPRIIYHKVTGWNSFRAPALALFAVNAARTLRAGKHQIVHTHGNVVGSDVVTAHSCHKAAMRIHNQRTNLGIADRIRLMIEQKNYADGKARLIIAVSEGVKRELEQEYHVPASRIRVIPNGVDLGRFTPARRAAARKALLSSAGWTEEAFIALIVANEFERKGLDILLQTLGLTPNGKLVVAGADDFAPYLRHINTHGLEKRVYFAGVVQEIENIYAGADCFVFPSRYEAFSLATLEAAASGLPLLISRVHGTEELVQEGENGLFIERNADDIAAKLSRLASDTELRARYSRNARAAAVAFDWHEIVARTLKLYEELL